MIGKCNALYENIKKIEVDFSGEEKRMCVDGKELDSSKIIDMQVNIGAGYIRINATLIANELPVKELENEA